MQSKCLITSLILPRHPAVSSPHQECKVAYYEEHLQSYIVWEIFLKRFRISDALGLALPPPLLPTLSFPTLEIGSEKQRDPASSVIP